MGELGTRGTTERVPVGNSPPTAARAAFLPDGDGLQLPLRFSFQPRLTRGVRHPEEPGVQRENKQAIVVLYL